MAVLTFAMMVCLLLTYRLARVLPVVEAYLLLSVVPTMALAQIPMNAFGLAFISVLQLSLLSSSRATFIRTAAWMVALLLGTILWRAGQDHADPLIFQAALAGGPVNLIVISFVGWQLALSLRAQEAGARREQLTSETGHRLLGLTDASRINDIGWQALNGLAAQTPGLIITPALETGSQDKAAAGQHMRSGKGDGYTWTTVNPRDNGGVSVAVGHTQRVPPAVLATIESLISQITLAHQSSRAYEKVAAQARTDPLTGLANRQGFAEATRLVLAKPPSDQLVLLFIDLDNFKTVNDTLGHAEGDDLLTRVASVLNNLVRADDIVARLGGDEFAILFRGIDEQIGHRIAERIVVGISTLVIDPAGEHRIGASIGLVTAAPDTSMSDLLVQADVAMYRAKTSGKGKVYTWSPDLQPATE